MKSYMAKKEEIKREWFIVDAANMRLGRLATEVATLLRGKHKAVYTPHVDCGDNVIVINAKQVVLTGNKWDDKKYYSHSGYAGGLSTRTARELNEKFPERLVEKAVKGMLPKNKLGSDMYRKLYVYQDDNHKQSAQQPKVYEIKG